MKHETVLTLTGTFEGHAHFTEGGIEFWLARDLQHLLGYSKWGKLPQRHFQGENGLRNIRIARF